MVFYKRRMDDRLSYILKILSTIPEKPGCYQYFDRKGTIIYVGKAKNLRKRVSSYFQKEHENNKTRVLVKHIYDLKYIVVDSEEDALLLENNLIKQYRPRYNVLLKDDKTYPSVCVCLYCEDHAATDKRIVSDPDMQTCFDSRIHCFGKV